MKWHTFEMIQTLFQLLPQLSQCLMNHKDTKAACWNVLSDIWRKKQQRIELSWWTDGSDKKWNHSKNSEQMQKRTAMIDWMYLCNDKALVCFMIEQKKIFSTMIKCDRNPPQIRTLISTVPFWWKPNTLSPKLSLGPTNRSVKLQSLKTPWKCVYNAWRGSSH